MVDLLARIRGMMFPGRVEEDYEGGEESEDDDARVCVLCSSVWSVSADDGFEDYCPGCGGSGVSLSEDEDGGQFSDEAIHDLMEKTRHYGVTSEARYGYEGDDYRGEGYYGRFALDVDVEEFEDVEEWL